MIRQNERNVNVKTIRGYVSHHLSNRTKEYSLASLSLLAVAWLSFCSISSASAASSTANASINVASACTLTTTGTGTYSATMNPGATKELTGSPLKVSCNDKNGYDLYAIGFSGDSYDTNNTDMLSSLGTSYNIKTNTSGSNSYWAMKVAGSGTNTPTIDNSYSNYKTIPTTYTKISHFTGTTTNSITTPTYKVTLSSDQAAGTYTGKVKYTIVHPSGSDAPLTPQPSTAGCINYFANASDAVGTMGCQSKDDRGNSLVDGASVTLLASNFSRTGYGFAGWSDSFDYATNPNAKFYGPNETFTVPTGTTANGLSLYAVWIKSQGNLQDTAKVASVCSGLDVAPTDGTANLKSVSALTDQRDNNTYAIAKLADGNCWMIENLRLESTAEHNSDGTLSQGYGGQFAGLAVAEPAWAENITTANSLYSKDGANDTINIGISYADYRFPRYNNINTPTNTADRPQNPTTNRATNSTSNASMYSYGNYYTWAAAIADTTSYSSGDHNTTSICPTGWQLPLGDTSTGDIEQGAADATNKVGGFSYLDRKMGGTGQFQSTVGDSLRWRKYPVNFVYSGDVYGGSVEDRGSNSYFWSSSASSSGGAYDLNLISSIVLPGMSTNFKYRGRPVRCVAPGV